MRTKLGPVESLKRLTSSTASIVLFVAIAITLFVHFTTGNFYTVYMLQTFFRQVSFVTIIGFALTLILLIGCVDLSIASIASLGAMASAWLMMYTGVPEVICILIGVAVGALCGLVNSLLITKLKLIPFIVTLATAEVYRGIVYVITEGRSITSLPASVTWLGQNTIFEIGALPMIFALIICAALALMLRYTPFGRHIYAIGGNPNAARIVGVRVERVQVATYLIAGGIAAFAGILMALRLGTFQPNVGENWTMNGITAAVLGGTAMKGGVGGVVGTIAGGLLIGTINYALGLLSVSAYWQSVVLGAVVIGAVAIDALTRTKRLAT